MTTAVKSKEEKTEFTSFCTFPFDPATNSDCHVVCQKDEPEEFAKCLAHFQTLEVKPKAKASAKGGRGKSFWGHINGTQAGLIDDCLVKAEKPVTIQEIAKFANGKLPRTLAHVKYLVKTKGAAISLTKDSHIFWHNNPNMLGLKAHGCVTGLFLKKAPTMKSTKTKELKDAEEAIKKEEKEEKEEGIVKKDAFAKIKLPAAKSKTKKVTPKTKKVAKVEA